MEYWYEGAEEDVNTALKFRNEAIENLGRIRRKLGTLLLGECFIVLMFVWELLCLVFEWGTPWLLCFALGVLILAMVSGVPGYRSLRRAEEDAYALVSTRVAEWDAARTKAAEGKGWL
jgi:hypothetical protein